MTGIDEMVEGYCDGCDPDVPAPSENRSAAYRHGFANGRDDLRRQPRNTAEALRKQAEEIIAEHDRWLIH